MYVTKFRAKIIRTALADWRSEGLITPDQAAELDGSIVVAAFDYKKLAKWAFAAACLCFAAAFVSLFASDLVVAFLAVLAQLPLGRLLLASALSAAAYRQAIRQARRQPLRRFRNEALMTLAVFLTAWAVAELGLLLDTGSGHYSLLLLLACVIYLGVGWYAKSGTVWLFALFALGGWFGAETAYWMGGYYLGMSQPLRFVLFGGVLTAAALRLQGKPEFRPFFTVTLIMGLLYLLVALWILSIWGNGGSYYRSGGHLELFCWSVLFAAAACGAIWLGLKRDVKLLRGFGLTFLFINLYTRFFEYFWGSMSKAIFFGLVGLSLWLLARKAERIWLLMENRWGALRDPEDS